MANQYSADVPKGFNIPKQVRLDSITGIQNEETLKNLGSGNNLAFKYYEGLKIYCKDEKTTYLWREVVGSEIGLLDTHFIYPIYNSVDGINYSEKSFNFFQVIDTNITPPDGSETKLIEGSNITILGTGTTLDPYEISSSFETSETYIEEGNNITITGTGVILDPFIINADLTDLGIIKTIDNEIISPGQTLSIINGESTGKILVTREYVESVIPLTPDGSETKINSGDNIIITGTGTILNPYIINSNIENTPTYINEGDDIEITGIGTIDNPYIINSISSNIVHKTGDEIISGFKSFNDTISAPKFYAKSNLSNPDLFAIIAISQNISSYTGHIIEDSSIITPPLGANGYGIVDISSRLTGTNASTHFHAFQSRLHYDASVDMSTSSAFNTMTGFFSGSQINGTGNIDTVIGFKAQNHYRSNSGRILNQYGLWIENQTEGTISNYGIWNDTYGNYIKGLSIGTSIIDLTNALHVNGSILANSYTGSAVLTGIPVAPTAPNGTNTTQIATTAFVQNTVTSGTYIPILTNTTNISSSILNVAYYTKIGNIITVTIAGQITLTSTATPTLLTFTLPISSAISINGVGQGNITSGGGGINAYGVINTISTTQGEFMIGAPTGVGPGVFSLTFTYSI